MSLFQHKSIQITLLLMIQRLYYLAVGMYVSIDTFHGQMQDTLYVKLDENMVLMEIW